MRERLNFFIFIDALGFELVSKHHFASDFLTHRYRVTTQLGYSAGAVPTILSGESPEKHHHFSFFRYDPKNSPFRFMRFMPTWMLPDWLFSRHRVRHHISKLVKRLLGYTGYFQLYSMPFKHLPYMDYTEKRDMFVPGGLAPVRNLADAWQGSDYRISDWRNSSDYNFDEMAYLIRHERIENGFLYSAELDGFLHFNIGSPENIGRELLRYEGMVRRLYAMACRHYKVVTFAVISDHGMTPLSGTIDLAKTLHAWKWGRDYISVADSTMARFWWCDPAKRDEVRSAVSSQGGGHWLTREELQEFRVDFPDRYYGDDIFLLDPGGQIAPSDMGRNPLPGMHGYSPQDKDSDASFLCNRQIDFPPVWIGDYFRIMTSK
ncbi:MAG: alkaline phosphatase family protein [Victivallaceae bacterium]|nr:alkaline phosphatase family protein [Victivallaceae bacterium]